MADVDSLTVEILKQIRDEIRQTNARLDQTNARLDQSNERLGAVESTLLDLAEQQRFVVRMRRTGTLRTRVDAIEAKLG